MRGENKTEFRRTECTDMHQRSYQTSAVPTMIEILGELCYLKYGSIL